MLLSRLPPASMGHRTVATPLAPAWRKIAARIGLLVYASSARDVLHNDHQRARKTEKVHVHWQPAWMREIVSLFLSPLNAHEHFLLRKV